MWFNLWYGDEGKTYGSHLSPYVNFRLSSQFQLNVGTGFGRDHNNTQWLRNFVDASNVTHYSFAHLDQRTTSMSVRLNYTFTPDLTLELYAQPFVAEGTYTDVREISATPEADAYDARFQPYTPPAGTELEFKVAALNSNSVLRWEYLPGSTLFVVWQHGRQGPGPNSSMRQAWTRDYRELFDVHPDNTFLVKVAYWLSR
jgi:hypothetical protein